jgi:prevent-host-death family protein
MNRTWQVQEAKAKFSELLESALKDGPQIITKRGVETAVLVPINQWRGIEKNNPKNIKDWLLAPEPRTETLVPPVQPLRRRPPPTFN